MSNPENDLPEKNAEEGKGKGKPKPRGFGGIFIIFLLLASLFWAVNHSSNPRNKSLYIFWKNLFNGNFEKVIDNSREGILLATMTEQGKDGSKRKVTMEVPIVGLTDAERETIITLQAKEIDKETYSRNGGAKNFIEDVESGKIEVIRAWSINWQPRKGSSTRESRERNREDEPETFLTAIILEGNNEKYVKVAFNEEGGTLQAVSRMLKSKAVPITHRSLTPDMTFEFKETNTFLLYVIGTIAPWILIIGLFWFFIIRQMRSPGGAGGVLNFGRSKAHKYDKDTQNKVTFADVEGMDEAKEEVSEIIEFLKNRGKFQRLGGRIPRGVLLVGGPGTGKTLLARAIAGEADVPFYSISGSDFVEMFVGVGASRVRDLFKQARENSPCIVFLDEVDAVGRKRGSGIGGGHDEREQTLNAILVEMDGFETEEGVILIGATNRPDVLDPALLRPGRFDRQIVIDMPDARGREAILKVHAKRVKMEANLDIDRLARTTPGFSGAELAALINEAAILAGMTGEDEVTIAHCEEARDRVKWGREKRSRALQEEDRRVTAYHEAGHAIVATKIKENDPVHKVTIISRGMSLGSTMSLPEKDDNLMRRKKLLGMVAMCYGGRIAEDLVFNDISAGAQNDIKQATAIIKTMVTELGMSDAVGPLSFTLASEGAYFLGSELISSKDHSEETAKLIDKEIRRIADECYDRAKTILKKDRSALDTVAEALLEYETISGEELKRLLSDTSVKDLRPVVQPTQAPAVSEELKGETKLEARQEEEEDDLGLSGAEGLATP